MRRNSSVLAAVACAFLMGAPSAFAEEKSEDLTDVMALVEKMQSQLEAQSAQIEAQSEQIQHQGEVIREQRMEEAQRTDERFGASGISAFLQRIQVDGHVAGSYFYNFNSPGPARQVGGPGGTVGGNTGLSGLTYPFHGNHNSFQVDQVWFGIEHPVDEENRAGFRFDLLYGTTACTLGNSVPTRCGFGGGGGGAFFAGLSDNTSEYYVNQAYIQYLIPFTENGILIKAGKWGTIAGAEVAQATANFNITRGNVYNFLQPIDHVGVIASSDIGDTGFSWQAGVANDLGLGFIGTADPDRNEAKSVMFQLAWSNETISILNSVLWGMGNAFDDNHGSGLYDLVVTWDPTDRISTWLNFDYAWSDNAGCCPSSSSAWGLALAGRFAVTERFGIASRFEVVQDEGGFNGWANPNGPGAVGQGTIYSITGTADYALTSNLTVRTEIRYDNVTKDFNDNEFFDQGGDFRPDQTTAGVELVYSF